MSNKLKMKKSNKKNREEEVRANTTPWLIGLVIFAVVVVGLAVASSFVWGTQTIGGSSDSSVVATTAAQETTADETTGAAAVEEIAVEGETAAEAETEN